MREKEGKSMDKALLLAVLNNRKQECRFEVVEISTGERKILAEFDQVIEAPNWTKDGKALIYNSNGGIYRFDLHTLHSEQIDTGFADLCNNDHVLSPDGTKLAISHFAEENGITSKIYILPITGGIPACVTEKGPSYLHGWSPDGNYLSYCAERDGAYHIYSISIEGGEETQLTDAPGNDDGPEYDPSGEKIWFNSTRSGLMQIWCMNADGSEQKRMSKLDMNCWFPHISPDGKLVAYLAYRREDLKPEEHLPDKQVQIRLMDAEGNEDRVLVELQGGQGSINVNSWSPDGKYIAFVSY
jgi:Tol biopolymer transport system component